MSSLRIETADGRTSFLPGERISGVAAWSLPHAPASLQIQLLWTTRGKGTVDTEVVASVPLPAAATGRQQFEFVLPPSPFSFSGKLVSLLWALRLVSDINDQTQLNITVSPTGREIDLLNPSANAR